MKKRFFALFTVFLSALFLLACNTEITLESPKNVKYDGTYISWDDVKSAEYYLISINESTEIEVYSNSYKYNSNGEAFNIQIISASSEDKVNQSKAVVYGFTYLGKTGNIAIDNGTLVWDSVDNATGYRIKVNGTSFTVPVNEYQDLPIGKNAVQILPLNSNDPSYYGVWSDVYNYTILEAPNNVKYNSSEISWDNVLYASAYKVKVNDVEYDVNSSTNKLAYVYDGQSQISIQVKAIGNEENDIYASTYSEAETYAYLDPVANLNVEDGIVNWTPVDHATSYLLQITTPTGTKNVEVTTSSYDGLDADTQYQIKIFAQTDITKHFFSSWSPVLTVRILPSPLVEYKNGSFIWNSVSGATGYQTKIMKNGEVIQTETSSNEGSYGINYTFSEVGTYTVQVKALSTNGNEGVFDSQFSQIYNVIRLDAPNTISFTNNASLSEGASVLYNPVTNASGYKAYINGVALADITASTSRVLDDTKTATLSEVSWQVQIQSIGSVNLSQRKIVLDSPLSTSYTVTKLAVPTTLDITNSVFSWNTISKNEGYLIDIDGTTYLNNKDDINYLLSNLSANSHRVKVRALGNGTDIISSDYSAEYDFSKLPKPQVVVQNGHITWNKVDQSSGYVYSVNATNGSFNIDTLKYDIQDSDIINQQVVFNIYAKGNGKNILDSESSSTGVITKLSSPQIRVTDDVVSWENISGAITYDFYVGEEVSQNGVTGTSFLTNILPAGNYLFKVIAIGNPATTISSNPSNILQITKLEAPTVVNDGVSYTWNSVSGAQSYVVNIQGNDYVTTDLFFNPYEYFTTARSYTITVRAINSGTGYINSDKTSITQVVSNLTQPEFEYVNNLYDLTISINDISDSATAFYFYINGNLVTESSNTYTYTAHVGIYELQVGVKGGIFIGETYYKDSLKTSTVKVTYLSSPSNVKIIHSNLSSPIYEIQWDALSNATYQYQIYDQSMNLLYDNSTTQTTISNLDLTGVTSITVKIKAIGTNSNVFESSWTEVSFNING